MARILQTDSIETVDLKASSQIKLAIGTPSNPSICGDSDENTGFIIDGSDKVGFSTGGVRRLTILPNGNIGIGVEAPVTGLQIIGGLKSDNATFDVLTINNLAGDFTINNSVGIITNGAITSDKLLADCVISGKILDGNVTTSKIADQAITNDKILDGTITSSKLNTESSAALDIVQSFSKQHNFTAYELAGGSNINWDLDIAQVAYLTLQNDGTLLNPINQRQGGIYILVVKQDDVGGRSLFFGSDYVFPDNVAVQLNGVANRLDILSFISIGGKMYGTYALNYMIG